MKKGFQPRRQALHALPYAAPRPAQEVRAKRISRSVVKAMEEPYANSIVYGYTTREGKRKREYQRLKAMYERDKRKSDKHTEQL